MVSSGAERMEYKQFVISTFERSPGKWRACVQRKNGKSLKAAARKLEKFATQIDASSAVAATIAAIEMIDAGAFARGTGPSTEKFWRLSGRAPNGQRAHRA
jgi:hypothetical protein